MYSVLIAEDEKKIRETYDTYLSAKGLRIIPVADGEAALSQALKESFDLIILDVMMPGMDGITACKRLREFTDTPIIFLSALGEEEDYLKGYKSGADDYIAKPFPLAVLYEKCISTIQRYRGTDSENIIRSGGIELNLSQRTLTIPPATDVELNGKDFDLLSYLMQNKNTVLSRDMILNKVWGYDYDGDIRVVDTHIKRIRKALGEQSCHLRTVVNSGYMFKESNENPGKETL